MNGANREREMAMLQMLKQKVLKYSPVSPSPDLLTRHTRKPSRLGREQWKYHTKMKKHTILLNLTEAT